MRHGWLPGAGRFSEKLLLPVPGEEEETWRWLLCLLPEREEGLPLPLTHTLLLGTIWTRDVGHDNVCILSVSCERTCELSVLFLLTQA